ncbi:hypothetical protein HanIR_Chr17g0878051 [Helianthus annuus]|nr:hypothetical protein HanIR_Chr17g0878051 [Helianthus annuus]
MFRDILTGDRSKEQDGMVIFINPVATEASKLWMGVSLVGEVSNMETLCNLEPYLLRKEMLGAKTSYVGGLKIKLTFQDEVIAKDFLENYKEFWNCWLSNLAVWEGQKLEYSRIVWVTIRGVPLELWDRGVFNSIAERFGRIIQSSEVSGDNGCLTFERVGILAKHGRKINDEVTLCCQGMQFKVWVAEDEGGWSPSFISWNDASDNKVGGSPEFMGKSPEEAEKSKAGIVESEEVVEVKQVTEQSVEGLEEGGIEEDVHAVFGSPRQPPKNLRKDPFYFSTTEDVGPSVKSVVGRKKDKPTNNLVGSREGNAVLGLRCGRPYFDLNLKADDPFDLENLIWKEGLKRAAKKRKCKGDISETFAPGNQSSKRSKKNDWVGDPITAAGENQQDVETQVELEGAFSKEEEIIKESLATVEVGVGLGVDLVGFDLEVSDIIKGEMERTD